MTLRPRSARINDEFFDTGQLADCREMRWTQPNLLRRELHLLSDGDVIATLVWQKLFGSLAIASTPFGSWYIEQHGGAQARVGVRPVGSHGEVAGFAPDISAEGVLRTVGGGEYRWFSAGLWGSRWKWTAADYRPLMRFRRTHSVMGRSGEVLVAPLAAVTASAEMQAVLLTLGWYLALTKVRRPSQ